MKETNPLFYLIPALFALPLIAFAGRLDGNNSEIRQIARSSTVKVKGTLSCKMADTNVGEPCAMTLHNADLGRTYTLKNGSELRKIYEAGTREVAVEGNFLDTETIKVTKVQSL